MSTATSRSSDDGLPVYAVTDERRDGTRRILATYIHPACAKVHVAQLRMAGADSAEVLLLASIIHEVAQ